MVKIGGVVPEIQYDTRCYFNVRSKADIYVSQLNLSHGSLIYMLAGGRTDGQTGTQRVMLITMVSSQTEDEARGAVY